MKIIAVVELDNWISQFKKPENKEALLASLTRVVELYKHCDTVNHWVFRITYAPYFSSLSNELGNLGVELKPQHCIDPLNRFYELVNHSLLNSKTPNRDNAIIRLLASKEDPASAEIDAMVNNHIAQGHHYSRNLCAQQRADMTIEIMNFSVLREAWQEALLPDDRIHITPYIYRQQQRLNLGLFPTSTNSVLHA